MNWWSLLYEALLQLLLVETMATVLLDLIVTSSPIWSGHRNGSPRWELRCLHWTPNHIVKPLNSKDTSGIVQNWDKWPVLPKRERLSPVQVTSVYIDPDLHIKPLLLSLGIMLVLSPVTFVHWTRSQTWIARTAQMRSWRAWWFPVNTLLPQDVHSKG